MELILRQKLTTPAVSTTACILALLVSLVLSGIGQAANAAAQVAPALPSGIPGLTRPDATPAPPPCVEEVPADVTTGPPPVLPEGPPPTGDLGRNLPQRTTPLDILDAKVAGVTVRRCPVAGPLGRIAPAQPARSPAAQANRFLLTDLLRVPGPPSAGIILKNAPDPELFEENGTYYLYATGTQGRDVALFVSKDLLSWKSHGNALDLSNDQLWFQRGRTWAPAVEKFGDTYVMYFTAWVRNSNRQCIGTAISNSPLGLFKPVSALPLVCDTDGGSIDASIFTETNGTRYLQWKNDGNSALASGTTVLFSRELTADGLGFSDNPAAELIRNNPASWEAANPRYSLVEQPEMVQVNGQYFLFYSANQFNSASYGVGYATCDGPQGPCRKNSTETAWLTTYPGVYGPGALSIANGPNGELLVAFHGWPEPVFSAAAGGYRQVYLAELVFTANGPELMSFNTGI